MGFRLSESQSKNPEDNVKFLFAKPYMKPILLPEGSSLQLCWRLSLLTPLWLIGYLISNLVATASPFSSQLGAGFEQFPAD